MNTSDLLFFYNLDFTMLLETLKLIDLSHFWDRVLEEVIKFAKSEQIWIATLGVMAIDFSQSKNTKLHPFASILGLLGQPFWFYMAYKTEAWGVGFLCCLYTKSWFKGFKKYWIDKPKEE